MSSRGWLAAIGAVAMTATLAACANLPTSGTIQISTLHGAGEIGQSGVQMVPEPPGKGWSPQDIVEGFMAASADYDQNHRVAKEFLTSGKGGFAHRWQPGWAATIVDAPAFTETAPFKGSSQQGGGPQSVDVAVTSKHVAALRTSGRYQAGSVVVMPSTTSYHFELVHVDGQWRINNIFVNNSPASPSLLLLRESDFEREYQARNLYFYPATGAADALVPDPVYIPAQVGKQGISGLVKTLLRPGLDRGWLFAAARTAFPPGTKLLSAQVVSGVTAVVNLGGAAAKAGQAQRQRMAAQLYASLVLAPYAAETANPIRTVVLKVNGHGVPLHPQAYAGWVPRGPSKAMMYYQMPVGPAGPAALAFHAKPSQNLTMPLPKALRGKTFADMAVSPARVGSAVLAGCRGATVYLMPQSHAGRVITGRLHSTCTSLSFDDRGELWVVTKMQIYVIPRAGTELPAHPALTGVLSPAMDKASIQSLQVAPDGVRAALLINSRSGMRIRIAAISQNRGQYTYVAQNTQMLRVGTDVAEPIALTWLDPDHLLVVGQVGTRTQLYEVPLNGGQSVPIATPRGAKSVAVSWPAGQSSPSIAVAIPPTDNSSAVIQLSTTGLLSPDWHQVAKGITPVFPG
jgi:hypothetical protein